MLQVSGQSRDDLSLTHNPMQVSAGEVSIQKNDHESSERFVATGGRLSVLREAEVCEGTGHKNAQPTRPEGNAQPANLHLPSKDDPQQMHDRHDEKQRSGSRHISFPVQSDCLSASRPTPTGLPSSPPR
jgi:hypothetical protein